MRTVAERFWSKVDRRAPSECWEWQAYRMRSGYGAFRFEGRPHPAQRVAYTLSSGPIPDGMYVCHSCDNPPCCNPAHLWLGTAAENNADRDAKGRARNDGKLHGERHHKARLTRDQVLEIFRSTESDAELGRRFGVSTTAIFLIKTGRNWKHVTGGAARQTKSYAPRMRRSRADQEAASHEA